MSRSPTAQVVSQHFVQRSESDRNEYRGIVLQNDLKVLLVSDPTTDKAAAAICVHVGYMNDPRPLQGLAHFCEHMLFLGTKKYPEENHYSHFLAQYGGRSNAFTLTDHTCFYFDVSPDRFPEAVDIFAQFFIEPRFDQACSEREINAIDSENDKNIIQDRRRAQRLERFTANPEHEFSKFSTGNRRTLCTMPKRAGIDVQQALLDFHEKWYSSNLMTLCLFGKESLDELEALAMEMFSAVPNKKVAMPVWPEHPFGEKELRVQLRVVPIKDIRQLTLTFPTPDLRKHYRSQPAKYISHLVGHEGEGSVYSYLKRKGWITSLNGGLQLGARGFSFFKIAIDLSPDGLQHTDEIVTAVFQYLSLLRQQGPQEWVFAEMKNLGQMKFRFKPKENPIHYATSLAIRMNNYDWQDLLSAEFVVEEFRPDLIMEVLSYLVPDRVRITLVSRSFAMVTRLREKYYDIEYAIDEIPAEKIAAWKTDEVPSALRLPPTNLFIPTNFSLVPANPKYTSTPTLLVDEPHTRIWFLQDKEYNLPTNAASFELRSPLVHLSPLHSVISQLIVLCFKDANKEYFFNAEVAGCLYYLSRNMDGFLLELRGYNEHQQVILEKIFERLINLKIDPARFDVLKDAYSRKLRNFEAEPPYEHAVFFLHWTLGERCYSHYQLLEALENDCTLERCEEFAREVFKRFYVEALIHGNVTCEEARKMGETPRNVLKCQAYTFDETPNSRDYRLNDGECYRIMRLTGCHQTNAVFVYYQVGSLYYSDIRTEAANDLLCQILEEPSFKILRAEEQLGYLVSGGRKETYGSFGVRVVVQSQRDSLGVLERIDRFINDNLRKILEKMDQKKFTIHKQTRIDRLLERPKKLDDLSEFLFKEISQRTYNFKRKQLRADAISTFCREDIVSFFHRYLSREGLRLKQMVITVDSMPWIDPIPTDSKPLEWSGSNEIENFKTKHTLFEGNPNYSRILKANTVSRHPKTSISSDQDRSSPNPPVAVVTAQPQS